MVKPPWTFFVPDSTPLGVPTDKLVVSRTSDLGLAVSAEAPGSFKSPDHPEPGTVSSGTRLALLTGQGEPAEMDGFHLRNWRRTGVGSRATTAIEGSAWRIAITRSEGEPAILTEWLANVPKRIWTRTTERTTTGEHVRGRESEQVRQPIQVESLSRDHAQFSVEWPTISIVRFGTVPADEAEDLHQPGFLEFRAGPEGLPSESERYSLRCALEFLLGTGMAVVGWALAEADGNVLQEVISWANIPGGMGPPSPPAYLGGRAEGGLDERILSAFVTKYLHYEQKYDLNRAVWLRLHARKAPLDMAAGYLGAAFEVLRRSYYAQPENERRSRIVGKPAWRRMRKELERVFDAALAEGGTELTDDGATHMKLALNRLNEVSGSKLNALLLDDLGLKHGSLEASGLKARNDAAHANPIDPNDYEAALLAVHALETLLARVLFAIVGIDIHYVDYSTLGHPLRKLSDPQGEPPSGSP